MVPLWSHYGRRKSPSFGYADLGDKKIGELLSRAGPAMVVGGRVRKFAKHWNG